MGGGGRLSDEIQNCYLQQVHLNASKITLSSAFSIFFSAFYFIIFSLVNFIKNACAHLNEAELIM